MKNHSAFLLLGSLLLTGAAHAGQSPHWGYTGHEGPEHWASLDSAFSLCGSGKNQSPINLTAFADTDLPPLALHYGGSVTEEVNNGHTVQANYAPGSTLTIDGHTFELKQFHFHTPSENQIESHSFPMEAHLVHADKDGNLAVIAVMLEEGAANDAIAALWQTMPTKAGEITKPSQAVAIDQLLPKDMDYYRFNGSLTTPPCSEGVRWLVLKHPVTISKEQVEQFAHVMHHPNNRPLQPINARPVLQ